MCGVVRNHEKRMLTRSDNQYADDKDERVGPEIQADRDRGGEHQQIMKNRRRRPPRRAAREALDDLARQRLAEVVLEFFAFTYRFLPPGCTSPRGIRRGRT